MLLFALVVLYHITMTVKLFGLLFAAALHHYLKVFSILFLLLMLFLFFLGSGAFKTGSECQVGEINCDACSNQLLFVQLGILFGFCFFALFQLLFLITFIVPLPFVLFRSLL